MTACVFWTSAKQTSTNVIRIDGMIVFISGEFRQTLPALSRQFAASADRRFKFQKSAQFFICMHNENAFRRDVRQQLSAMFPNNFMPAASFIDRSGPFAARTCLAQAVRRPSGFVTRLV